MPNKNDMFEIPVGNLAYDFTSQPNTYPDDWDWQGEAPAPYDDEMKVVLPAEPRYYEDEREMAAARPKVRTRQSVSPGAILGFAVAAVLLVFTLMAKIQLTQITDQAVKLEEKLVELKNEKARLEIEYEGAFNLKEIEEYAIRGLGMQRPREEQIFYLQSSVPDKAVVMEEEPEEETLLERLFGLADFIAEYFR